ncbi:MAG: type II toxin-antitoxin system RelE/ParE family toxin [Prevotella sp.]|nr:type II toxin-antitoxin system RelE/ParE family toxin [Prevotella sp.]
MRETLHTLEYEEYYASLDEKTKAKFDYVESIIKTQYVVNKKFVKNLEGTEFYEARVSVGTNEHRTIIFAIDSISFIESKRVLFLNSFLKKSTKQYKREVENARQILNKYI